MNLNTSFKITAYLSISFLLYILLIREYTYVHPYNTGWGILGPGWKYASTCTFTWGGILVGAVVLSLPLLFKQKWGFIGLFLLTATAIRPMVQSRFPEEQAIDFYRSRALELNQIITQYDDSKNNLITNQKIIDLDFDQLAVYQGTYYFLLYGEDFATGICYDNDGKLPDNHFGRTLKYTRLDDHWYEFDYTN